MGSMREFLFVFFDKMPYDRNEIHFTSRRAKHQRNHMANNTAFVFSLHPAALGKVTPEGWLRSQLVVQQNGLSGHIDALWEDLGEQSGWLGGAGENWERGPYYLDGLIPLAWSLGDAALQQKAQRWIEWMLQSQRADGFFGPADNPDWP